MSELKECPFCGGEAELLRKGDHRQSNQVSCMYCGAELEDGAEFNHEGAWNTRPREEELEKENNKLNYLDWIAKQRRCKILIQVYFALAIPNQQTKHDKHHVVVHQLKIKCRLYNFGG